MSDWWYVWVRSLLLYSKGGWGKGKGRVLIEQKGLFKERQILNKDTEEKFFSVLPRKNDEKTSPYWKKKFFCSLSLEKRQSPDWERFYWRKDFLEEWPIPNKCSREKVFLSFSQKKRQSPDWEKFYRRKVFLEKWPIPNKNQVFSTKTFSQVFSKKRQSPDWEKFYRRKVFSWRVADSQQEPSVLEKKFFSGFL